MFGRSQRAVPVPVVADHVATVDVGNPHVVLHVADPSAIDLQEFAS